MVGQELVISVRSEQPPLARKDPDPAFQASKEVDKGSRLKRLPFTKKDSRLAPQASKKGRRVPERLRVPDVGVEDFVPWVAPITSRPPASEEEEEEDEMAYLVHNFSARKHKRGANFNRATNAILEVVGEADKDPTGGGSEEQAIVVMDSLRWAFMVNRLLSPRPR